MGSHGNQRDDIERACSNLASQSARASALTRSHLFSTSVNGTFVCSMDTRNRVSCFGSSGGRSSAKTSSAWSTLATGGSSSCVGEAIGQSNVLAVKR